MFGKRYGIKWGSIGNILWKHIDNLGNTLRTHWEHDGNTTKKNTLGTTKIWKILLSLFLSLSLPSSPPPPPKSKGKKIWVYWAHAAFPHWLTRNFYLEYHLFWHGQMARAWMGGRTNLINATGLSVLCKHFFKLVLVGQVKQATYSWQNKGKIQYNTNANNK